MGWRTLKGSKRARALLAPAHHNPVVAAPPPALHRHRLTTAEQVDLNQVGQRSEHGAALAQVLPAALAGALVGRREDRDQGDDLAVVRGAYLQVGLADQIGQLDLDDDGAVGAGRQCRGVGALGTLGAYHGDVGATSQHEVGGLDSVGTLLDRDVVARAQAGGQFIAEGDDQAIVEVWPEVGLLEVGVHPGEWCRHPSLRAARDQIVARRRGWNSLIAAYHTFSLSLHAGAGQVARWKA